VKRLGAFVLAALLLWAPAVAFARGHGGHSRSHSHSSTIPTHSRHAQATTSHPGHHHRIKRDPAQRHRFMQQHPCPGGPDRGSSRRCHGYVVDHIEPLKRGGPDRPSNMQWQTTAEAKSKDRWE
jgi:hypothetical protein